MDGNKPVYDFPTWHIESAAEFVVALQRSNSHWLPEDGWESPWVFRGENSDGWQLIPTAWRPEAQKHEMYWFVNAQNFDQQVAQFTEAKKRNGFTINHEVARRLFVQNAFEFQIAKAFHDLVDELGLMLPGGLMPAAPSSDPLEYPDYAVPHPVFGLARHHKVPTRLIDWTGNPLIAAFFAAFDVKGADAGNIVVWALNQREAYTDRYRCREYRVPRSQIGFLNAQEGLFTYTPAANQFFLANQRWPCVEEMVPSSALRRLTLPKSEAPKLLRLLWAERISKAHLMPTLDNVKDAIDSNWKLWFEIGSRREPEASSEPHD